MEWRKSHVKFDENRIIKIYTNANTWNDSDKIFVDVQDLSEIIDVDMIIINGLTKSANIWDVENVCIAPMNKLCEYLMGAGVDEDKICKKLQD